MCRTVCTICMYRNTVVAYRRYFVVLISITIPLCGFSLITWIDVHEWRCHVGYEPNQPRKMHRPYKTGPKMSISYGFIILFIIVAITIHESWLRLICTSSRCNFTSASAFRAIFILRTRQLARHWRQRLLETKNKINFNWWAHTHEYNVSWSTVCASVHNVIIVSKTLINNFRIMCKCIYS